MSSSVQSSLVLGWEMTKGFDPTYWIGTKAAPGKHAPQDVVSVSAADIARHFIVVAQSGSGKSFFLGRLIEEILIKSKSRVVIVDPNSDFRRIALPVSGKLWETAKYDVAHRRGFLPDEASVSAFKKNWDKVSKVVWSARIDRSGKDDALKIQRLEIDWTGISTEVLSGELDPVLESEIRRCHDFVRTISRLIAFTKAKDWSSKHDLLEVTQQLCESTRGMTQPQVAEKLRHDFTISAGPLTESEDTPKQVITAAVDLLCRQASIHRAFVSEPMEKFYFSNAFDIRASRLLRRSNVSLVSEKVPRLQVVDIPSITESRFRPWIVSTILSTEWQRALRNWEITLDNPPDEDSRVPTFIVIDEAHNLVPAEPRNYSEKGLREQIRRIAAEGRKFGLFLILVSQRPDKLDPLVVSECENRVVMKLGSQAVLSRTQELLGLTHIPERLLERTLEFDVGRALLAGAWVNDNPVLMYSAARRTEEGGRNLRASYWAVGDHE
jgi:hypothetical protein